jgi:nicotinamidase-related amidase
MGYDLSLTAKALDPIKNALDVVRTTDMKVVHTREGHDPDLSDAPFNKILRSKIIGHGVGIGETPENGLGKLLVRGEKNWDIHEKVYPIPGEYVVDKAGKGAFGSSTLHMMLKNLGVTHLVISGITTDVCVHTIMREANDYGYWCILMKDGTGATDQGNHEAAIKSIKMQGGVFGNVTDSKKLIDAIQKAFK